MTNVTLKTDKFWKWSNHYSRCFHEFEKNNFSLDDFVSFLENSQNHPPDVRLSDTQFERRVFAEMQTGFPKAMAERRVRRGDKEWRTYRGDFFEVFAECFFNTFPADKKYGLIGYTPIQSVDDYGVDAFGTDANGEKCIVQIKYRASPQATIKWGCVAKAWARGRAQEMFDDKKPGTIIIFTTASALSYRVGEAGPGMIKFIGRDIIGGMISNNKTFWKSCSEIVENTIAFKKEQPADVEPK